MCPRPRSVSDEEILLGTGRVVGRLGPAGLTLAEVGREVGLAPPTLLQRFGSKRGLLLAFAAGSVVEVSRTFAAARRVETTALEALTRALVEMTRGVATPDEMANHLAFLQMDLSDPEFGVYAREHAAAVRAEIGTLIREAVTRRELATQDVDRLARVVHAVFNGTLLGWALQPEGTVQLQVREAVETLLRPRRLSEDQAQGWGFLRRG